MRWNVFMAGFDSQVPSLHKHGTHDSHRYFSGKRQWPEVLLLGIVGIVIMDYKI